MNYKLWNVTFRRFPDIFLLVYNLLSLIFTLCLYIILCSTELTSAHDSAFSAVFKLKTQHCCNQNATEKNCGVSK